MLVRATAAINFLTGFSKKCQYIRTDNTFAVVIYNVINHVSFVNFHTGDKTYAVVSWVVHLLPPSPADGLGTVGNTTKYSMVGIEVIHL